MNIKDHFLLKTSIIVSVYRCQIQTYAAEYVYLQKKILIGFCAYGCQALLEVLYVYPLPFVSGQWAFS